MSTPPGKFTEESLHPWIDEEFDRGGGPGGQNVNKVNTRAVLLFDWRACTVLTPSAKARIRAKHQSRMAADGRLRIVSQTHRTQLRNRSEALARLVRLLEAASVEPKPRVATRPSRGSKERRIGSKKRRSETLRSRTSRGEE
jgi:ribosome-associated protein